MADIAQTISELRGVLPEGARLVAVSKYHPVEKVAEALAAGQTLFGESQAQELVRKHEYFRHCSPQPEWHFIGHLQTNKVKYIAPFVTMIESVDSERLLAEIDRQAERWGRVVDVLLELHVAQEQTKAGLTVDECHALLDSGVKVRYKHVRICGLMTMATYTDDETLIAREFQSAYDCFNELKTKHFPNDDYFCERSWGMSDDYPIALQHGATLVRIGSKIFGERA